MVKSNNTQVTISAAMLNCLKQVLFSQTNGVDLSPIVEDLGGDDKTAIAVALAYKGIKPEIDAAPRFDYFSTNYYHAYKLESYSIIRDSVTVSDTCHTFNKETQLWEKHTYSQCVMNLSRWLNLSTSEEECRDKVRAYVNPVGKESKTVLRVSPKN